MPRDSKTKRTEKITRYVELLKFWNAKMNLVGTNILNDFYSRHYDDCRQLTKYIDPNESVIDIGSGAGLPGVVLVLEGQANVTLCEISSKKSSFLRKVKVDLELPFEVFDGDILLYDKCADVCVSRAFAPLLTLLHIMTRLKILRGVFMKGRSYLKELTDAKSFYEFDCEVKKSTTNEKSAILIVMNVRGRVWG